MSLADAKPFAVAAWALGEASGTRVDQVGANDLTDNNTVLAATGQFGDAADFEASNSEYLSIADNADLDLGDADWMIRLWVKFESSPSGSEIAIFSKDGGGSDRQYRCDWHHSSNRFRFFVFTSSNTVAGSVSANNFGAPSTGVWYLVHAWHDATNNQVGIAVNSGTADTAATSAAAGTGTAPFTVGAFEVGATPRYMDGLIDDVVVLDGYILDATERTEDYNSGAGVAFADWDAGGGHPVALITQHRYGLTGRRYGSFAGKTAGAAAEGSGVLSAVAELAAEGARDSAGSGALVAVASLTATGEAVTSGSGVLSAVAELTAEGTRDSAGSGSLVAVATLEAVGEAPGVGASEGSGVLSAVATMQAVGEAVASGSGSLSAVAVLNAEGSRDSAGTAELVAIAELVAVGTTRPTKERISFTSVSVQKPSFASVSVAVPRFESVEVEVGA